MMRLTDDRDLAMQDLRDSFMPSLYCEVCVHGIVYAHAICLCQKSQQPPDLVKFSPPGTMISFY